MFRVSCLWASGYVGTGNYLFCIFFSKSALCGHFLFVARDRLTFTEVQKCILKKIKSVPLQVRVVGRLKKVIVLPYGPESTSSSSASHCDRETPSAFLEVCVALM